eukprot:3476570-Prymnesium_polylepis.1
MITQSPDPWYYRLSRHRNQNSYFERRLVICSVLDPGAQPSLRTRAYGRRASVLAPEGSGSDGRWWNRRSVHQLTRSVDAVTAKRSKRALSHRCRALSLRGETRALTLVYAGGGGSFGI